MSLDDYVDPEQDSRTSEVELSWQERVKGHPLYSFAVDTAAQVSFSLALMIPVEYYYVGLEPDEIVGTRVTGAVAGVAIGYMYNRYRNWLYRRLKTTEESSKMKTYLTELLAMQTFQNPVYLGMLAVGGADEFGEYLHGMVSSVVLCAFVNWPLGFWFDTMHRWFGLHTAKQQAEIENGYLTDD